MKQRHRRRTHANSARRTNLFFAPSARSETSPRIIKNPGELAFAWNGR